MLATLDELLARLQAPARCRLTYDRPMPQHETMSPAQLRAYEIKSARLSLDAAREAAEVGNKANTHYWLCSATKHYQQALYWARRMS